MLVISALTAQLAAKNGGAPASHGDAWSNAVAAAPASHRPARSREGKEHMSRALALRSVAHSDSEGEGEEEEEEEEGLDEEQGVLRRPTRLPARPPPRPKR